MVVVDKSLGGKVLHALNHTPSYHDHVFIVRSARSKQGGDCFIYLVDNRVETVLEGDMAGRGM